MLKISGNQIVNASTSCTVRLRGVNVSGLEHGVDNAAVGGVTATAAYCISNWKCNYIRLPLDQDRWFFFPYSYRTLVDSVVNLCSANNCYVILDLHWSGTASAASTPPYGTGWGTATAVNNNGNVLDMPDSNSTTFWSDVANRYKNNPAVLFDLYNEPHDVSAGVWKTGGSGNFGYTPGFQNLLTSVRATGANNICIVGGLQWAYDFTGLLPGSALTDTGNGVLYDGHIYASKGESTASWDAYITNFANNYAFMIGEFGPGPSSGSMSDGGTFDNVFIPWANGSNQRSYVYSATAWSMDVAPDDPPLLTSWTGFAPTSYHGTQVMNWLATANTSCAPALGGPTYTPTPVPTQGNCFMLSDLENGSKTTPYAVNALNGKWFTFRWTTDGNGNPLTPTHSTVMCPDTQSACPAILDNTTSVSPGSYSAYVSGSYDLNGTSTPATYSGFGLATEFPPGYTDLSWVTNVSFYIKTTVAPVTLRLQASNPQINQQPVTWNGTVYPGGGNGNQYGFNFVVTQPNVWTYITRPLSAFEWQDWGEGGGSSPINGPKNSSGTLITQPTAFSDVLSFQWETQDGPTTVAWWIDNVCLSGSPYPITPTPSAVPSTSTFTPTPTPTFTSTRTNSPTNTATSTYTKTGTPTPTPTFTVPLTPTPTNTATSTSSPSSTATSTNTMTHTPTSTSTSTSTLGNTSTYTMTVTPTSTLQFTSTNSFTSTPTSSPTQTSTNSRTNTTTPTSTPTSTRTSTLTPTPSNTSTPTPANTNTFTSTGTSTPTFQFSPTSSDTPTITFSPTLTLTPTNSRTSTSTPTFSPSSTSTSTATYTSTPVDTSTPTSTSTFTRTGTPTSTSSLTPTRSSTMTATWTLSATSTGTATPTLSPTLTLSPTSTYSPTNTFTLTFTSTSTLSPTYTSTPTHTFTYTPTLSPTFTPTATHTFTWTFTATQTNSPTLSPTFTTTFSPTFTSSDTPVPQSVPVIYPNPADGTKPVMVRPPYYYGSSNVKVQLFTLGFRKVAEITAKNIPWGTDVPLDLVDRWNKTLANGLYYVLVTTSNGRTIGKLLLLR